MREPRRSLPLTRLTAIATATALATVTACSAARRLQPGDPVPFPADYRAWQHVKSMVIEAGHPLHGAFGGIHHVYGNAAAIAGLQNGSYADGAVFAFDLLAAEAKDHAITEGSRKVLGVMHKDRAAFASTGGWGFAGFDSAHRDVVTDMQQCYQCHAAQEQRGYVFSAWRP